MNTPAEYGPDSAHPIPTVALSNDVRPVQNEIGLTASLAAVTFDGASWQAWSRLVFLCLVVVSNYLACMVISVLLEPIKHEFNISDTALGLLTGPVFALMYATTSIPIARWADLGNRRTVLTLALTAWSIMAVACGTAHSFWQLTAARLGMGAASSGALPPAQSLVVDYFPPKRRAIAMGALSAAMTVGYMLSVTIGGYIATAQSWRAAFVWSGVPGLALAFVARFVLSEPRRTEPVETHGDSREGLLTTLSELRRKLTCLYGVLGLSAFSVFAYGATTFLPSFMVRSLHASLAQIATVWGPMIATANIAGSLLGGVLCDHLSRRDLRWRGWLGAISCMAGGVLYLIAFRAHQFSSFIALEFLAETSLSFASPGVFAAIHAVCGARRRAMAAALAFLAMMLVGNGLGPLTVGALSDALAAVSGLDSLRNALTLLILSLLPAAGAFWALARAIPQETRDV